MRLRAPDHADDIVQKTLLHAFKHRDQLRVSSKFKSWLCSIAMNEVRSFFRTHRTALPLDELPSIALRDLSTSPLARAENLERAEWLQTGIAKLSKRDREVIRLRDLDEWNVAETAAAFKSSVAAIKSTHFRARKRLASALTRVCGVRTIERREGPGDFRNSRVGQ
jgi:RNA polymerase sigma-70 factor (ECF subfamily)